MVIWGNLLYKGLTMVKIEHEVTTTRILTKLLKIRKIVVQTSNSSPNITLRYIKMDKRTLKTPKYYVIGRL